MILNPYRFAGAAWVPTDLANLFAWYDTSDAGSITHSSGLVDQINDKSGNARHLTGSSTARPTYSTTELAGSQPGMTFDGGDKLANTSFTLSSGTLIHAWVVMRPTGSTSYCRVVSFAGATEADFHPNGYIPILRKSTGNTWGSYSGYAEGTSSVTVAASNTAVVGTVRTDSSNYFMVKNGTESSTVALSFPSGTLTKLGIGARADTPSGDSFSGVISEVIIVAGATPSSGERAAIQSYLAAKWTLT